VSRIDRRGDAVVNRENYLLSAGVTTFSIVADSRMVRLRHSRLHPAVLENSAMTMAAPSDVLTIDAAIGISIPDQPAGATTAGTTEIEVP
jgi:hypothetical protein